MAASKKNIKTISSKNKSKKETPKKISKKDQKPIAGGQPTLWFDNPMSV